MILNFLKENKFFISIVLTAIVLFFIGYNNVKAEDNCFYFDDGTNELEYCIIEIDYGEDEILYWLDRNLGAEQVCNSKTDSDCYGYLYQWGRGNDGHQLRNSSTQSENLSSTNTPDHNNFIYTQDWPNYDWRSPQNDDLWQGIDGINNPCPEGFRIPTKDELWLERNNWSSSNANGAYDSTLKWGLSGWRHYADASFQSVGSTGYYWSSTTDNTNSITFSQTSRFSFGNSSSSQYPDYRASGEAVRCVADEEPTSSGGSSDEFNIIKAKTEGGTYLDYPITAEKGETLQNLIGYDICDWNTETYGTSTSATNRYILAIENLTDDEIINGDFLDNNADFCSTTLLKYYNWYIPFDISAGEKNLAFWIYDEIQEEIVAYSDEHYLTIESPDLINTIDPIIASDKIFSISNDILEIEMTNKKKYFYNWNKVPSETNNLSIYEIGTGTFPLDCWIDEEVGGLDECVKIDDFTIEDETAFGKWGGQSFFTLYETATGTQFYLAKATTTDIIQEEIFSIEWTDNDNNFQEIYENIIGDIEEEKEKWYSGMNIADLLPWNAWSNFTSDDGIILQTLTNINDYISNIFPFNIIKGFKDSFKEAEAEIFGLFTVKRALAQSSTSTPDTRSDIINFMDTKEKGEGFKVIDIQNFSNTGQNITLTLLAEDDMKNFFGDSFINFLKILINISLWATFFFYVFRRSKRFAENLQG